MFLSILLLVLSFTIPQSLVRESFIHMPGDIIQAKCECGFEQNIFLGAAKSNYKTFFGFPFYCKDCSSVMVLNYLEEKHYCKECSDKIAIPYDDDCMRLFQSDKVVFGWNADTVTHKLYDDFYLCPKCKEFKMIFTPIGNWD